MISVVHRGNFEKTEKFFSRARRKDYLRVLSFYGERGLNALAANTPVDTGKTAKSWSYKVFQGSKSAGIVWSNSNTTESGIPIVVLIQYGHGTRNGAYVQGRDFINPAIQPIFDEIAEKVWEEVVRE